MGELNSMEVKDDCRLTHQLVAILGLLARQSSSVREGKGLKESFFFKKREMPDFWQACA